MGPDGPVWFKQMRVATKNVHGTGCTLSSAIAACLARGYDLETAVRTSKAYVTEALTHSIDLGRGPGPLHHFHNFYRFR
jgi:hydroxymethylpyrimidine/phosphomethylpyrimidine kinase